MRGWRTRCSDMEDSQKLEDEVTSEEVKDEMGEIQVEDMVSS